MTNDASARWDRRYQGVTPRDRRAAEVLEQNAHLLPRQGDALDLAAGVAAVCHAPVASADEHVRLRPNKGSVAEW